MTGSIKVLLLLKNGVELKEQRITKEEWAGSLVVEHVLGIFEDLGAIPSNKNQKLSE